MSEQRTITINGKQVGKKDVYLDLSKLSEEEIKIIYESLNNKNEDTHHLYRIDLKKGNFDETFPYLTLNSEYTQWRCTYRNIHGKQEINHSQFLELMGETKQPKYRFKTLEEFEKEFEKNKDGDYVIGKMYFVERMFHLVGIPIPDKFSKQIMNNPDGIVLDLGDIVEGKNNYWNFTPGMLILNEQVEVVSKMENTEIVPDNSETLEKAKKLLQSNGYAVFPLDENGIPDLSDWKGVEMLVSEIGRNYWLKDFIKAKIGENKFLTKHCLDVVEVRPIQPDLTPEEIVEKLGKDYLLNLIEQKENERVI